MSCKGELLLIDIEQVFIIIIISLNINLKHSNIYYILLALQIPL